MTRLFVAFVSFIALTLGASSAFACKCERNIKPIKGSKMIFWGKVKQITPRGSQDKVKMEIVDLYKGEERPEITVYSNRFEHDCGFHFQQDKSYVVYGRDFYPRGIATGICWGTYEAEEKPDPNEWKKVDPKIEDPSKFIKEMRSLAKKIVPPCGRKNRVKDAGFSMILSPDGDPIRPPRPEKIRERVDNFQQCVAESFQSASKLPKFNKPVRLVGWYQGEVRRLPVMLDEMECGDDCPDWENRVRAEIMDLDGPEAVSKSAREVKAELDQCLQGGIEAVHGESFGTESHKRRRNRMLADCAARRGEFGQAAPYYGSIDNEGIVAALKWAVANGNKGDGPKFPIRKDGYTFPKTVVKGKKNTDGEYRILRSHFINDPHWAQSPVYLEAFAESILADSSASSGMKDYAALAYHRAGQLVPEAAEAYNKLADKASRSKKSKELRDELAKAFEPPPAPVEEEPVEEVAGTTGGTNGGEGFEETSMEAEGDGGGNDQTLLIVAGVLIVVAVAGIATILKKRR